MPCNLHFGDSTAHGIVAWFLAKLSDAKLSDIDKYLSFYDSNHANAETLCEDIQKGRKDLENLCKDLNAVRFIDCLRDQMKDKDKDDLFKRILGIAERLNKDEKWKDFPNLIALLFSIVQKRPDGCVKDTDLYKISEKLYEHFKKKQQDSPEDRDFIFKIGFQLLRFKMNDESWQREFAEFKTLYHTEVSKLRRGYYSVDNPAEYSRRVIVRWTGEYDKRKDNEFNSEFKALAEEFFRLDDPSSAVMHPMSLELPIRERSTEALRIADDFVQKLNDSKKDDKEEAAKFNIELANKFRIVQWDILVRNLVEESREEALCFHPITDELDISGSPDLDSFLLEFIRKAREIEKHFTPYDGEIPKKRRDDYNFLAKDPYFHEDEVKNCRKSFEKLLPKVPDYHPDVYEDLVQSFSETWKSGESTNTILIEDGELSFFSLLWLLRSVVSKQEQAIVWTRPEEKLSVRFRPSESDSPNEWWSQCNMYDFAEELGLIIRLTDENCVLTRRWRSLVAWLRRLNYSMNRLPEDDLTEEPAQKLPVKMLDYTDEEKSFLRTLREFFGSEELREKLDLELNVFIPCKTFAGKFKVLIELLKPLIEGTSSGGLKDKVLLRCCRAGFIPLEHLFRAYQPYELHLLIQALNWEESTVTGGTQAPISLGFATIAGQVELSPDTTINSGSSEDIATDFRHWLGPYRSFFSALSANIALPAIQEASEQIGIEEQKGDFAHQTSNLLDSVWNDPNLKKLHFRSKFALWVARIHVSEMWGYHPIDTEEILNEKNVPYWEGDFINKPIVDVLIDLGIWGGIIRANKTPKGGRRDNREAAKLTRYARDNLSSGDPQDLISEVRKLLSFNRPDPHDNPPPDWVHTRAFAICFYHGMWQAVYHALWTFVVNDECKLKREWYLSIGWDDNSVSIENRGEVKQGEVEEKHQAKDRLFFEIFMQKTDEFCRQRGINEKFAIYGPEPVDRSDTWRLLISKEKSDEL